MQVQKDTIKKAIIDAACEEFYRIGYSNASTRIIAQRAGITVGNVYRYFKNKESILESLLTPLIDDLNVLLERDYSPPQTVDLHTVRRAATEVFSPFLLSSPERCMQIYILLEQSGTTPCGQMKQQIIRRLTAIITDILSKAKPHMSRDTVYAAGLALASAFLEGIIALITDSHNGVNEEAYMLYINAQTTALFSI